jgi:hypothetical protein
MRPAGPRNPGNPPRAQPAQARRGRASARMPACVTPQPIASHRCVLACTGPAGDPRTRGSKARPSSRYERVTSAHPYAEASTCIRNQPYSETHDGAPVVSGCTPSPNTRGPAGILEGLPTAAVWACATRPILSRRLWRARDRQGHPAVRERGVTDGNDAGRPLGQRHRAGARADHQTAQGEERLQEASGGAPGRFWSALDLAGFPGGTGRSWRVTTWPCFSW